MNCSACGADNREGAKFCRMCGEQISKHLQDQATVTDGDEEGAKDGAVLDQDLEYEAGPATAASVDELPVTELPEMLSKDSDAELLEGVDGEPEVPSGVQAEDASLGRELVLEAEDADEPSEGMGVEPEDLEGEVDQPVPEIHLAAESPEVEGLGSSMPPASPGPAVSSEVGGSNVDESMAQEPENLPGEPVAQTTGPGVQPIEGAGEAKDGTVTADPVKPGSLMPLVPGTVIGERLRIVGVLDDEEDETLYLAYDLLRCWQCDFQENEPDDTFCAQCGASLDREARVRLLEVQSKEAEPSGGEAIAGHFSHKGRHFLLLAEPDAAVEVESGSSAAGVSQRVRLVVGQYSDAGQVRELDEDSLLALTLAPTYESRTGPVLGLFAVADGMGGHEGGEVASKVALQVLADEVLRSIVLPVLADEDLLEEEIIARLRQATVSANDALYLARQKRGNDMGTTLTTALIRDDRLFLAHVGDCRAYRWGADGLQQLTTDHSLVASMIASGQAAPEEIYTHPHRSVIYRCVGDQPVVEVDTDVVPLVPGDRLIVCCDGLWEMVRDEGIQDVMMQEVDPQAASEMLVNHANAAGGDDNISVIIVQVESA